MGVGVGVDVPQRGRRLGLVRGGGGDWGGRLLARHRGDGLRHARRGGVRGDRGGGEGGALRRRLERALLELRQLLVGVILAGVLLQEVERLGAGEPGRRPRHPRHPRPRPHEVLGRGKTGERRPQTHRVAGEGEGAGRADGAQVGVGPRPGETEGGEARAEDGVEGGWEAGEAVGRPHHARVHVAECLGAGGWAPRLHGRLHALLALHSLLLHRLLPLPELGLDADHGAGGGLAPVPARLPLPQVLRNSAGGLRVRPDRGGGKTSSSLVVVVF